MDTKEKILDTGLKLFSKKGYLGATTREIAREAGVAEVTLFRHFPSKEKLFEEVINTYSFLPALKGLLPTVSALPYEEALMVIAKRFLETLILRKELIQIMNSEVRRYPDKINALYHSFVDEIVRTLAAYFAEMGEKGVLRDFDTEFGARAFLGLFFSYFNAQEFLMRRKYTNSDTETAIREYVSFFARGTMK